MKQFGIIDASDEYMLSAVTNPKDRYRILAIKEKKWKKEQEQAAQQKYAAQMQVENQRSQTAMAVKDKEGQNKVQQIYAKGDVESKLMQLGTQLGLTESQMQSVIKHSLQNQRLQGKIESLKKAAEYRKEEDATKPLV